MAHLQKELFLSVDGIIWVIGIKEKQVVKGLSCIIQEANYREELGSKMANLSKKGSTFETSNKILTRSSIIAFMHIAIL